MTSKALPPWLVVTVGAVVLVDQLTKVIVRMTWDVCPDISLPACDRIEILGPVGVIRAANGASAFGLLGSNSLIPLLVVALMLIGAQTRMVHPTRLLMAGTGLQLGGLAANLVDRLFFGAVTDFIHVQLGDSYHGLVANPADIALVIGGAMVAVALWRVRSPG